MLSNYPIRNKNFHPFLRDMLFLLIGIAVFYGLWLGSHSLFIPDEGRYTEVAREMVVSHDYITPRLNGVAFLDKPALYYWLQTIAIKVFGLKEWSLRFWPCFFGILGCLVTYVSGFILFNRRVGIVAALILGTAPLYYGASHYANLDLEVAVLISISLLLFLLGSQPSADNKIRLLLAVSAYLFSALAVLTKGLIGIVFPMLIIGCWILFTWQWALLKKIYLPLGIVIFSVIALPWYYLVQKANPAFLHFFFVTQQISRFLTTQDFNDKAAWWFYLPVIFFGFFPWSVFLIQSVVASTKKIIVNFAMTKNELFLLIWLVAIFIFFSIPQSKTVGYILPVFPPAALLIAIYLDKIWDQIQHVKIGIYFYLVLGFLLSVGLLITPHFQNQLDVSDTFIRVLRCMGIVLLISVLFIFLTFKKMSFTRTFTQLVATIILLSLLFIANAEIINTKSVKPLALHLKNTVQSQDEIVTFYRYYQDLPLYLGKRITIVADWDAKDIPYTDNWLREIWYGMIFQETKDWLIKPETFWQRWYSDKRIFVLTDMRYFNYFKDKKNVYKVDQYHDVIVLTNQPSDASLSLPTLQT